MLRLARHLNPGVKYIKGDMRSIDLKDGFDAVLVADSINYMLTEKDLIAAFKTAFRHLHSGGVFVTCVEETPERFIQGRTRVSNHQRGDTEIVFVENAYDPDAGDSTYEVTFVYLIRKAKSLEICTDRHLAGMFPLRTWRKLLRGVGFVVDELESASDSSESDSNVLFVCVRP
ncbi:MAG: class I SAM-dependent methyltransferase [Euryarchaeota archaeon]|nr:class I SAM-dependent methyltransferase [Euryarchaeota archaeon]